MTWADVYLVCFLVGFVLSVLSVVAGSFHMHFLHLDLHHGVPHVHVGHAHGGGHSGVSVINFGTIAAFLAWFGGTGEMICSQEGARRSAAARSDDGTAIPKDAEVVVTRYDKGIAYVRRWDELTGATQDLPEKEKNAQA